MNLYCVVDCKPIPPERVAKNANTCRDECASILAADKRSRRAEKKCRLCSRRISLAQLLSTQAVEVLEYVAAMTCGCYCDDDPNWHSERCSVPMAKSVLASIQAFRDKQRSRATSKTNRRSTAGVLMEHNGMVESVTVQIPVSGVDGEFSASGVPAALTDKRPEEKSVKVPVGAVEIAENISCASNLYKPEDFTKSSYSQAKVEDVLTVGAELPVVGDEQAVNTISTCSPVETVEMSGNEVCQ